MGIIHLKIIQFNKIRFVSLIKKGIGNLKNIYCVILFSYFPVCFRRWYFLSICQCNMGRRYIHLFINITYCFVYQIHFYFDYICQCNMCRRYIHLFIECHILFCMRKSFCQISTLTWVTFVNATCVGVTYMFLSM